MTILVDTRRHYDTPLKGNIFIVHMFKMKHFSRLPYQNTLCLCNRQFFRVPERKRRKKKTDGQDKDTEVAHCHAPNHITLFFHVFLQGH